MRTSLDVTPSLKIPIIYPTRWKGKPRTLTQAQAIFDAIEARELADMRRAEEHALEHVGHVIDENFSYTK